MKSIRMMRRGYLRIPKSLRAKYKWVEGQEFTLHRIDDGILLLPKRPPRSVKLEDVAGRLAYEGGLKTVDELEAAMKSGTSEDWFGQS